MGLKLFSIKKILKGIYSESKCTTTLYNSMNHCVLVVGYGSENGVPYWILKNQWGNIFLCFFYKHLKKNHTVVLSFTFALALV